MNGSRVLRLIVIGTLAGDSGPFRAPFFFRRSFISYCLNLKFTEGRGWLESYPISQLSVFGLLIVVSTGVNTGVDNDCGGLHINFSIERGVRAGLPLESWVTLPFELMALSGDEISLYPSLWLSSDASWDWSRILLSWEWLLLRVLRFIRCCGG